MTEKTYTTKLRCTNCDEARTVEIPLGTRKQAYAKSNPCNVCGCLTLELD